MIVAALVVIALSVAGLAVGLVSLDRRLCDLEDAVDRLRAKARDPLRDEPLADWYLDRVAAAKGGGRWD